MLDMTGVADKQTFQLCHENVSYVIDNKMGVVINVWRAVFCDF